MKKILFAGILVVFIYIMCFSCKHPPEIPPAVVSLPTGLQYSPNAIQVQSGFSISSVQPLVNGTQPISYAITTSNGASVGHVSINSIGVINADNRLPAGTYVFAVIATNGAGSVTFYNAYQIIVSASPVLPSTLIFTPDTLKLNQGSVTVQSAPPAVAGTHPIKYSITSNPSSLILINDSTGAITVDSGLAVGIYFINILTLNAAGSKTFNNAMIIQIDPVKPYNLKYAPAYMNIVSGSTASSVAPVIQGTVPITYTVISNPSTSLIAINANTGIITATSGIATGNYSVSVTASNIGGSVQFSNIYAVQVSAIAQAPSQLSYPVNAISMYTGQNVQSVMPVVSGTTPITFSLSSLPSTSFISINSLTGVLSASTSLPAGTYLISVTASNSAGSQTFSNVFSITATDAPPTGFSYPMDVLTIADDVPGSSVTPIIAGSLPITYSLVSVVPANNSITVNSSNGIINISSATTPGSYVITIEALNTAGSATAPYTFIVNPTFANDILPLMKNYCTSCHNGSIEFTNYNSYTMTKSDILNILSRCESGSMPPGGGSLTTAQINMIKLWQSTGMTE